MPLDEALGIARQIADALQTAHDRGVIHRDLKPANIKVKRDGTVKVLDFGLAKLLDSQPTDAALADSPTMLQSVPGMLLGTAAYMSPEQAKGQDTDRRADVWAFGCVLFEMLTGRRAFEGATMSEVLAGVLKSDPDWGSLPADTPEAVRRALRRCLRKDETLRLRDVGDARLDLEEAQTESLAPQRETRLVRRVERRAWAGAVALFALLAAAIGAWAIQPGETTLEERFDITTAQVSDPGTLSSLALSPNGRALLFVADSDGQPVVWVRPLDSVDAHPLPGTGGALFPFWSPDGRSVAFSADGFLKRLDLDGGLTRNLARVTVGVGGTWNRDGVILFAPNPASPILRIPADGGSPVNVTRLEQGHSGHAFPHFLPDGHRFLYYVTAGPDERGIYLGDLKASLSRKLLDADAGGVYTNGYLFFIRERKVFAQAFAVNRLELQGTPVQVADGVVPGPGGLSSTLSAAAGAIAFRTGAVRFGRQFTWVDRSGRQIGTVGDVLGRPDGVSPSPDGSRLVLFQRGTGSSDLWMLETGRGVLSRFIDDPAEDIFPLWTRDGSRIVFSSNRNGRFALYQKQVTGNEREELLFAPPAAGVTEVFASDTSPDGRWLLYQQRDAQTGWDLWALPLTGERTPVPVVQTEADERGARLSPDGKWLAYVANNSGPAEVFVQPFPGPGPKVQVSTAGGDQIRWRSTGTELFYIALDRTLVSVPLQVAADGRSIDLEAPVPLFPARVGRIVLVGPNAEYVVTNDAQRFLINTVVQDADSPIRLILNWNAAHRE